MKEFVIGKNDAGQRLDRWLAKTLPLLPAPLAQKYIRLKRVKVNGRGSKRDVRLNVGDVLQLYINCLLYTSLASWVVYFLSLLPMGANSSYQGRPFSWPSALPLARRYCQNCLLYTSRCV